MRRGAGADADADDNADRVLPWEEQRPIWARLIELRKQGFPIQNSYHYMRRLSRQGAPPPYRCHWPKIALGVDANGDVVDCQDWSRPVANVRDGLLVDLLQHRRMVDLRGPMGEACNACTVPARIEPSRFWGLHPAVVMGAVESLVLRR
jgi:MoaA/NifB/PqqE/SkfB family radical SAM enzyme